VTEKSLHKAVLIQMSALVTAAFGLVAALAWNGAIQALFKHIFGTVDSLPAQLTYAIIVTIIATVVTWWVARTTSQLNGDDNNSDRKV
jgi:TRAP-type C4-dicarboxylate transport system permease small subunit